MADNKNYDRLPEESLAELRRKYLRKKPLYGKAPTKKAFTNGSSYVSSYTYHRSADVMFLISVIMLTLMFLIAPFTDGMRDISAFNFIGDGEYGFVDAIDRLCYDNDFETFLSAGRMLFVCVLVIISAIEMITNTFRAFKAFAAKRSSDLRFNAINALLTIFSVYTWLSILGVGNDFGGFGDWSPLHMSSTIESALYIALGLMIIAAIVSYVKGYSDVPYKKSCWWSSALLSVVYGILSLSMMGLQLSGLFSSAAAGLGMIDSPYGNTNTKFECILIAAFNVFIIITFFKLKKHVRSTLHSELSCVLGFGKGYVKSSPMASTRIKAAIMPVISIFAVTVLTSEETAIAWPVYGLTKFLIKAVVLPVISGIICKIMRDKTLSSLK